MNDGQTVVPSSMSREEFVSTFGGVYEHSPWVAEMAYDGGLGSEHDDPSALADYMSTIIAKASEDKNLELLRAHPELAGKLAQEGRMTSDSVSEQAGAGLNELTEDEFAKIQKYNKLYGEKFGFPYILAVRGRDKYQILENFGGRLNNDPGTEFHEALKQVNRIASMRIQTVFEDANSGNN